MPKEKKPIHVEIGMNVKREREKAGMTQERFSEMIEMGVKSLSAVECGTVGISLTTLKRICQSLSISADAILFGETEKSDVQDLTERLERLSPAQMEIVKSVVYKLLEAFSLQSQRQEP